MRTTPKPYKHQKKSLSHGVLTPIVFDTSDPGTGKTAVAIWEFAARHKITKKCALILAPRSLLTSVWAQDFKTFAPHIKVSVATADNREAAFAADADVYITNHDAVKWVEKKSKGFFEKFDTLIIDESSAYKHAPTQRSRAVAKIAKHFRFRRLLTGTPNGRSITDVWHQAYLLDGGERLGNSFFQFRNSVCTPVQVGRDRNAIRWEDKDGAEEAVFSLLSDITIRHEFEKCVDIPENHRYSLTYELTPKQLRAYLELERTQILELKKGTITAVNAAVVAGKLLQVASGAVYESGDKYHVVDTGRYKMALDLIEARKHSLCFFLWKHQRDCLLQEAEARGISYCLIDGATNDAERARIVKEYQEGKYQVLFAHPKSAAHGLTLTKGTATIWTSPTYDLELFEQGSKRQHRLGQTQKTETIVILAKGTIDERAYEILQAKGERMSNLLGLFASL